MPVSAGKLKHNKHAKGVPCKAPLGEVCGVWLSIYASIQIRQKKLYRWRDCKLGNETAVCCVADTAQILAYLADRL